jgi:hypothetical protein
VEEFLARVRALTDEERLAVAAERRAVDESFHEKAVTAGLEALADRGDAYVRARRAVAGAHVPERIEQDQGEVARLVQLAIDDALLAMVGRDLLHPNHLRELYRPWRALAG